MQFVMGIRPPSTLKYFQQQRPSHVFSSVASDACRPCRRTMKVKVKPSVSFADGKPKPACQPAAREIDTSSCKCELHDRIASASICNFSCGGSVNQRIQEQRCGKFNLHMACISHAVIKKPHSKYFVIHSGYHDLHCASCHWLLS